jgi:MerR family mercuric resistance operon transcriptional regulator
MSDRCRCVQERVKIETIRYYERVGVLGTPVRSAGGRRQFGEQEIWRLAFIRRGRELGFSLKDIRDLLTLVDSRTFTCGEIHEIAAAHLETVRKKISHLKALDRVLTDITNRCSRDTAPDCPVLDALSNDERAA